MLDRRLKAAFNADDTLFNRAPKARLVCTEQFDRNPGVVGAIDNGTVSIFCHRVDINQTMRPPWTAVSAVTARTHVPVDAHFLLTAWESDAEAELRLLGCTLLALETAPILTGPLLHPSGRWESGESVQLLNEDLVTEDAHLRDPVGRIPTFGVLRRPGDPPQFRGRSRSPRGVTAVMGLSPSMVPR